MGLTIHYEGKLHSRLALEKLIQDARTYAKENKLKYFVVDERERSLIRLIKRKVIEYSSLTQGIIMVPGNNCEPVILEFDNEMFMQHFCKTQYSSPEVHVMVIELLDKIKPYFNDFQVLDEAGYWEQRDFPALQERMGRTDSIYIALNEKPGER